MAGRSTLKNGSSTLLDVDIEVYDERENGSSALVDVDIEVYDECEIKLRSLFDDVVIVFSKEDCIRPLPVVLGDGETLDLFKLFVVVREKGGFDSVSRDGLWGFVTEKLGFDRALSPSVRLVYSKYLKRVEKRGMEISDVMKIRDWNCGNGCFGNLLQELGSEFKSLLDDSLEQKCKKDGGDANFECKNSGKHVAECVNKTTVSFPNSRKRLRENVDDEGEARENGDEQAQEDNDKKTCDDRLDSGTDSLAPDSDCLLEQVNSKNRKREVSGESFSKMLKWVIQVAKCPHSLVGVIPQQTGSNEHKQNEYWVQAIRARQALMQRRKDESRNGVSLHQGNQKMHPSAYNDNQQAAERLRCSERLSNPTRCRPSASCTPITQTEPLCFKEEIKTSHPEKTESETISVTSAKTIRSKDEFSYRHVAVGPRFQAEVPVWTKPFLDSDPKWLGKRIWPQEKGQKSCFLKNGLVGKGRPDSCSCDFRGSVECIRFHIAENRIKLKQELGPVFFHWKFHCMGEEICLRWTDREEKLFKNALISDPLWFWQNTPKLFPKKTRQDLLSYYFNVLLINRRRYQNRVTPKDVDSDDDGTGFGCVGYAFGHEVIRPLGSENVICSQNFRRTALDQSLVFEW